MAFNGNLEKLIKQSHAGGATPVYERLFCQYSTIK